MTSPPRRLLAALVLSLLAHGLPFVGDFLPRPQASAPRPLVAELRPPAAPLPETPPLFLPEPPAAKPAPPPPPPTARPPDPGRPRPVPATARSWQEEVKRQFRKLHEAGLFYPEEAITRGLEGEALVLLVLDAEGNAVAVRLEASSGHAVLDEAALRAARSLRSLPGDASRETLIPVRFRLR